MKAVVFGAGNIGRGFIGMLLAESGYRVTFVDVDAETVRMIRGLGFYPVRVLGTERHEVPAEVRWITDVTAVDAADPRAAEAVAEAEIVVTAVGKNALPAVAGVLRAGIARRQDPVPVIVIACENMLGNSTYLRGLVAGDRADLAAVFPDCMVDRIVPNRSPMPGDHPLLVAVEEYCQWTVDGAALRGHPRPPQVEGLDVVDDLDRTLTQKLFTVNMAHAIVAYWGHKRGHVHIHEAMGDETIRALVDGALREASRALVGGLGVDAEAQQAYVDKTLRRLANPALQDTVLRVGRDPKRKLGAQDRLVRPALGAIADGVTPAHLATGIAAALSFEAPDDPSATEVRRAVTGRGWKGALNRFAGIEHDHVLGELVQAAGLYASL